MSIWAELVVRHNNRTCVTPFFFVPFNDDDIVEEEEGEFNDIIDEQGILVGEDLLVNDYIGSQEEGV